MRDSDNRGMCETECSFRPALENYSPPHPTPAGHAAQRLTRMCSDVWLWCRRAHAAVHIHHIAEAACVSSLASTQLALRQVFSCCKCSPGPGPNSRSMLKSNRLHVSTAGHIILWQSSLIVHASTNEPLFTFDMIKMLMLAVETGGDYTPTPIPLPGRWAELGASSLSSAWSSLAAPRTQPASQ